MCETGINVTGQKKTLEWRGAGTKFSSSYTYTTAVDTSNGVMVYVYTLVLNLALNLVCIDLPGIPATRVRAVPVSRIQY
jgi:hypothetical protein